MGTQSACQFASVAGTSLSPEGSITAPTDVLKIIGGEVNTCPAVLWPWPVLKSGCVFFFSRYIHILIKESIEFWGNF